jgi:DNA-binding NtrC family response regulator
MTRSLKLAQAVARLDVPVLLVGEPGVGLEALSRLIHGWSGRPGPYVPFHCAGIDPDALEWELHGRNGRSGLCKIADGGTLFLDSVSALGPESQRRLAAWVRSEADRHEEARVRIVAASRNQTGASDTSGLGEGLRRELEGVWVEIPPLRERPEDIPKLVSDIILESSRRFGRRIPLPGLSLIQQWQGRTWTGNLDELREAVERHVAHNLERLR